MHCDASEVDGESEEEASLSLSDDCDLVTLVAFDELAGKYFAVLRKYLVATDEDGLFLRSSNVSVPSAY